MSPRHFAKAEVAAERPHSGEAGKAPGTPRPSRALWHRMHGRS